MTQARVHVRELAGWGLDEYQFRHAPIDDARLSQAALAAAERPSFQPESALLPQETELLLDALAPHTTRADLLAEMSGLSWSLGVVDLRPLLAFQRRLSIRPDVPTLPVPIRKDWPALVNFSFGPQKRTECEIIRDPASRTLVFRSENPNLQFGIRGEAAFPLNVHTGSPFFEIARFRDRWFLRDGYHRAYALLKAGVFEMPAVIVQAGTIEELGATQPWFFPEEILFSGTPPRVVDFLNDDLVLEYDRPALIKTLRITMEESLTLATSSGEQL